MRAAAPLGLAFFGAAVASESDEDVAGGRVSGEGLGLPRD